MPAPKTEIPAVRVSKNHRTGFWHFRVVGKHGTAFCLSEPYANKECATKAAERMMDAVKGSQGVAIIGG